MLKRLTIIMFYFLSLISLFGEDYIAPLSTEGELVYIPFPAAITIDGDINDWENIEKNIVTTGPYNYGTPDDNGQFIFSVAADNENLFILMTMPDKKIVAGAHGTDFWNEDSFEFYVNFSGDLDATEYGPGIVQVNVNATNIENDNPLDLSLSGVRFTEEGYYVWGEVFETENGWGMEIAMRLDNNIVPYHGFTVGMQFNANGATELDRNVKLIWSKYDGTDSSWQSPHIFGTGVFYEIGSEDTPQPQRLNIPQVIERKTIPHEQRPIVRLNQVGYYPKAPKLGIFVSDIQSETSFDLVDSNGDIIYSGTSLPMGLDNTSKEYIHHLDFSDFEDIGTDYKLRVGDFYSHPFDIRENLYTQLKYDAMAYFYLNRAGTVIDSAYTEEQWAHPPFFSSDKEIQPFSGIDSTGREWPKRDYTLNADKGWFDAGDYGKYVVNGGISVWTLLNMYERNPSLFADGTLRIPESNNAIPDILDEVKWEIDFFLGMQVPEGEPGSGMVHHKLHEEVWSVFPYYAPEIAEDERFAFEPSTAATLNMAAATAQFSRLYKEYDEQFANKCLKAAEIAWEAANSNPQFVYGNIPGDGGGNYNDANLSDEFYWAAVELYITTEDSKYLTTIEEFTSARDFNTTLTASNGPMSWRDVATLGSLSLLLSDTEISKSIISEIEELIIKGCDRYIKQMEMEGYPVSIFEFIWGSNSQIANKMILFAYAYDMTGKKIYLDAMTSNMDYILGRNCNAVSFVSGYGDYTMMYPHHRFWANDEVAGFPGPPPGVLSGGPNQEPTDDATRFFANRVGRGRRYADNANSYSTNEVTINWNAPLVWVSAYMDEQLNPNTDIPVVANGKSNSSLLLLLGTAIASIILLIIIKRVKK